MSTSHTETLRDIARLASDRHGGAGGRAIARIAGKAGHTMAYTTFDKLLNGKYSARPAAKTLEALAYLSGVPVARVYEAAGREYPSTKFANMLPPDIDTLSLDQRQAVIDVARAFLRTNKAWERLANEMLDLAGEHKRIDPSQVTGQPARKAVEDDPGAGQKIRPEDLDLAANTDPSITRELDATEGHWNSLGEGSQEGPDVD